MPRQVLFVDNLNENVLESPVERLALLISALNESKQLLDYAHEFKKSGSVLVADNGNAKVIKDIGDLFCEEAKMACKSKDVDKQKNLAYKILEHCNLACNDVENLKNVLELQKILNPTYFMCGENLTPQVLVDLNLDREELELDDDFYVNSQLGAIEQVKQTIEGKYGGYTGEPFATLHGVDYDTAFKTGSLAGKTGIIKAIATGLAGFMSDRQTTKKYWYQGEWKYFKDRKSIPRKYFQSVAVAMGLIHGYQSITGTPPKFHGLGMGSPIAILLLAYAIYETPFLAVDSSAPAKNASMGKLYVSEPAYLTLNVEKISAGLGGKDRKWDCPCPHCQAFLKKYPLDYENAKKAYKELGRKNLKKEDLMNDSPLSKALPLFSDPPDRSLWQEIKCARTGHNYWVIDNLMQQMGELEYEYERLKAWVYNEVEKYKKNASKLYARSVEETIGFIETARMYNKQ